jgi:uncharacterized RDD family membrane protein YckC
MTTPGSFPEPTDPNEPNKPNEPSEPTGQAGGLPSYPTTPGQGYGSPAGPGFGSPAGPGFGPPPNPGFGVPFGAPAGGAGMVRSDLPPTAPEAYGIKYWPPGTPGWPALASLWKRLAAVLLDVVLYFVTLAIGWFIWNLFTWSDGQSPGKKLLKLRVVATTTGRPATWGHMILREWVVKGFTIGLIGIFTIGIGYLVAIFMIFGAIHQTLWDRIIHTVVVDETKAC